jgi:cytidyltransferase-like protein
VIVTRDELAALAGAVTMVDGGFDPIHEGHVAYFEAAAALGDPVFCSVSPDAWVERKHPVLLPQAARGAVVEAMRSVAYVHLATGSTVDVLELVRPRRYAKGADWRGRLPDEELDVCREQGIEVVYLETILNSSTRIMERFRR